ncbi:MAG: DNA-directed RNA polymerase subunit D [Archaeoglobaceae archaeon]|nr:DNA-directed RNA polymerase subunit D [Archaeoglobaceae archaeon]MDW7989296.1 DNA-directed RNA polymerase subunit D [Archaeoglobaceae archaeon]
MTKIEFLKEDEDKLVFILKDASPALANSIRRAMKSLVPVLAIDYVDFYVNSSYFYDEMIAHRLAMLPIKTELRRFNMQKDCICDGVGCPSCQVSFRLNIEGPRIVYSGDFVSDEPDVHFVYKDIPVLELFKGQQLMIEAVARLGIGKEHSKFQPVSACFYKIIPKIEIDDRCNLCGECISVCPRNVFVLKDRIVVNPLDCSLCMECVKCCEQEALRVSESNDFLFVVESTGAMPAKKVLIQAIEILKSKAENFNKTLAEINV